MGLKRKINKFIRRKITHPLIVKAGNLLPGAGAGIGGYGGYKLGKKIGGKKGAIIGGAIGGGGGAYAGGRAQKWINKRYKH